MRELRYPPRVLLGDYLRSAAGLFVGGGVLLAVPPNLPILIIFGATAALFAVFGLRTAHRHGLRVAVTAEEIACRGLTTKVIPWRELADVKLRYFGSRRSKWRPLGSGFMQLTLNGPRDGLGGALGSGGRAGTMTFESTLEGFDWLAGHAAAAMKARGLPLDPATTSNLIELGIDPQAPPDAGAAPPPDGCHPPSNVL